MKILRYSSVVPRGYSDFMLAYILYVGALFGKTLAYEYGVAASSEWRWLLILNLVEMGGWVFLVLKRHGIEDGSVILPLPTVCSLYSIISVALLAAGFDVYPFPDSAVREGMFLMALTATNFWFFTQLLISRKTTKRLHANVLSWCDEIKISRLGASLFLILGLVIVVTFIANFYTSGAASMLKDIGGDRAEILATLETGKTWLVMIAIMAWFMVCALLWLSKKARRSISPLHIWSTILITISFLIVYARLGNRRDMMTALIFVSVLLLIKGRKRMVGGILLIAVAWGMYVAIARSLNPDRESTMAAITTYETAFSEAIYPSFPLISHISSQHNLWWGTSYLRLPIYAVPSFGIWKKPMSLSETFAREFGNGTAGYAYTPLGEGYANFGALATCIVPLFLVLEERMLLELTFKMPRKGAACIPILIYLSLPLNINRGEFCAITIEITLYSLFVWLYLKLCSVSVRRWA